MSKLGEIIAWNINKLFPTLNIHKDLEAAKKNIVDNQSWAYLEAQRVIPEFYPHWNLNGKSVLDIGVGLGGKLPFYAECGASRITGIDINPASGKIANDFVSLKRKGDASYDQVHLVVSDASKMPFADCSFDAIVSINTFEHIEFIEESLLETYRVLRQGGYIYLHLPPYFSPWGPHLENWIYFPWPHLLFSEKTLMKIVAMEDAVHHFNHQFVQAAQINLSGSQDRIPDVNRITLRKFQKLIDKTGYTIRQRRLLPVGYQYFRKKQNPFFRLGYMMLSIGAHIPGLQEVIVTKMVYVLQK